MNEELKKLDIARHPPCQADEALYEVSVTTQRLSFEQDAREFFVSQSQLVEQQGGSTPSRNIELGRDYFIRANSHNDSLIRGDLVVVVRAAQSKLENLAAKVRGQASSKDTVYIVNKKVLRPTDFDFVIKRALVYTDLYTN